MSRESTAEFTEETKTRSLIACKRHCVLCEKFSGAKMTCHHIIAVADGGSSEIDNCLPICLNCHGEVRHYDPKHPVGLKYRPEELRRRRDSFYAKVSQQSPQDPDFLYVDRATFLGILALLPNDCEDIRTIYNHPFGAPFKWSSFKNVDSFLYGLNGPEHEFLDDDLEQQRTLLRQSLSTFRSKLANYTVYGKDEWVHINAEKHGSAYTRMANELDQLSSGAYESYVAFIRFARKRLTI